MSRFAPHVERHRWQMKFVPCISPNTNREDTLKTINYDPYCSVTSQDRTRPHTIRTPRYCWCHKDASAMLNHGILVPNYIAEIIIHPWNPDNPLNQHAVGIMKARPIHEDDMGNVYFRGQGSLLQYTKQEIRHMSRQMVKDHYTALLEQKKKELHEAQTAAYQEKMNKLN